MTRRHGSSNKKTIKKRIQLKVPHWIVVFKRRESSLPFFYLWLFVWLLCGCPVSHPLVFSVSHRWSHIAQNLLHSKCLYSQWWRTENALYTAEHSAQCTVHNAQCTVHWREAWPTNSFADQRATCPHHLMYYSSLSSLSSLIVMVDVSTSLLITWWTANHSHYCHYLTSTPNFHDSCKTNKLNVQHA